MPSVSTPNLRADAQRSRAAILDSAIRLLNDRPDAKMEAVAARAGLTRQTVYAHFPSRAKLRAAALDRITDEAVAAMDAADLDSGPAADALLRLVEAAAQTVGRYPNLLRQAESRSPEQAQEGAWNEPVAQRLRRVIRRGQRSGEFDGGLPADWLVAVVISISHTEAAEAAGAEASRLTSDETDQARRTTLLRALGHRSAQPGV